MLPEPGPVDHRLSNQLWCFEFVVVLNFGDSEKYKLFLGRF